MGKYNKPKARLHMDFAYLDHDSVLNALSAFEAGKVDEIIQKAVDAREGGLDARIGGGAIKAGGGRRKTTNIQEELVRTRTRFSAFEAWHRHLKEHEAIGTFNSWDQEVRDALEVGETVEFIADVTLSPVHQVIATFLSVASLAGKAGSPIQLSAREATEWKKIATMAEQLVSGNKGHKSVLTYLLPYGASYPKVLARLEEQYLTRGLEHINARFTVVGQVEAVLGDTENESVIRILRDVPPTPAETTAVSQALTELIEPAKELGVELSQEDLNFTSPSIVLRPLAIFR